jgi:hypothetical protein
MPTKSDVAPATLSVRLEEGGVVVEYLDGREVFYHGVPEPVAGDLRCQPGKDVHVLVTDEDDAEGVLVYVNERKTGDEILEDAGVGRVLLADGESEVLFPGVVVERDGYHHRVEADPSVVDGRVFVFVEDEFGESSYELVPAGDA